MADTNLTTAQTALTQIQTDDEDIQTQVTAALAAIEAALSSETGASDPNDAVVSSVVDALTSAGYTVTPPATS
jgi:hypothetical protein